MTEAEKKQLAEHIKKSPVKSNISFDTIIQQIEIFEKGIPYQKLIKPCTVGDGIESLTKSEESNYLSIFDTSSHGIRLEKFVPASGAATRMFKKLQTLVSKNEGINIEELANKSSDENSNEYAALQFIKNIKKFAFYLELEEKLKTDSKNIESLLDSGEYSTLINYVLDRIGLNYSNFPKGAIKFHSYKNENRTAIDEHLVETLDYTKGTGRAFRIHFTISPEHEKLFKNITADFLIRNKISSEKIHITYSYQNKSTDTIAVDKNNKPLKDEQGNLVFRPGGHGALLKNLNKIDSDIIFIKNIDNVCHDHLKPITSRYKKILGGKLIDLQKKTFKFLNLSENDKIDNKDLSEILTFIRSELSLPLDKSFNELSTNEKKNYLISILNRPIRVCGMVKNEGHAGGGPFWIEDKNGKISKQVVEISQIDSTDPKQKDILNSATHFSPVDFVCGIKNYRGEKFDLLKYADPETGLITEKTYMGKEIKGLELPGLWNGGMANWITIFVEVPIETFNPVKEVNDLLLPAHQPLNE